MSAAVPARASLTRDRLDLFAIVVLTLCCAIWGTQQVAVKVAESQGLPPALQATLRSGCAAMCLLAWVGLRGGRPALARLFAIDRSLVPGVCSAFVFSAEFLLLYYGLEHTTASSAVLFLYTSPFFVAVGVHLFVPAERLRLRQVGGLLCAFAGIGVAVFDGIRHGGGGLIGDVMVVGTAVLWATLTVLAKASPAMRSVTPAKILFYQLAGSTPIMCAVAAMTHELPALAHATPFACWLVVGQGCFVAFGSYLIWYWMITIYPAGKLAAFSFLTPLFGLLAGGVLLAEPITAALILALLFVAVGLYLVNGAARRQA